VPAWSSKADRFSAWATGVQAVGVIFALFLAGVSLQRDSHDRRVDRVMDLHRELVSGELSGPRFRLSRHLRELGSNGRVRSVSIWQLGTEGNLKYTDPRKVQLRAATCHCYSGTSNESMLPARPGRSTRICLSSSLAAMPVGGAKRYLMLRMVLPSDRPSANSETSLFGAIPEQ
jgi:hypothetical protein